ncbi:MAG: glycosyltransferase [Rhodocyclaceae bacterium]|nr:glycosyltransferase [Rhodocyclaceae bacterium]
MPLISIITPCFNEAENVAELHRRIAEQFAQIPDCDYEHIFIDNASTDDTVTQIRRIASTNSRVKAIVNSRNFGHIRSPMHALLQARGDAIITMASDLQDPPELIPSFDTLYDLAMLGITSHSKVPIRLATMSGFALSALSLLVAIGYLIFKIMFWDQLSIGMAPILIGFFFFASVQLFFIGILGEYIANIHTQVQKRPLVVEKERINFESASERD